MEVKINALMLRGTDYKDNDKMLALYSLEKGLVGACIKGVKKSGAKLKFASQPFCFAEYVLNVNGERATVTGASELESFYNLRLDINAYYLATVIAEYLLKCGGEEPNEALFMLAVNSIKQLNFSTENKLLTVVLFLLKALEIEGYAIKGDACANCSNPAHLGEFAYFDFDKGCLLCEDCAEGNATRILTNTAECLQSVYAGEQSEIKNYKYLLKFLNYYLNQKEGVSLKSIDELLQII